MPLVEFRDVSYEVGGRQILSDVNFTVEAGETLVLLGRSGSGQNHGSEDDQRDAVSDARGSAGGREGRQREWDPIRLKRRIGYVIQEVGLVPAFHGGGECRAGADA